MQTAMDVAWLRAWMAEAVRRVVARGTELWAETQALKAGVEYDMQEDTNRWEEEIDRVGVALQVEMVNTYTATVGSSAGLDQVSSTVRNVAAIAGIQLRKSLDGIHLDNLRNFDEWVEDYWHRGRLTIPADPVDVLRLVDSRLRPLVEVLRDINIALPGAEDYIAQLEPLTGEQAPVELTSEDGIQTATSAWSRVPDGDAHQRLRVRRMGGSLVMERQMEGRIKWTDLGAIPADQAGVLSGLLRRMVTAADAD